MTFVCYTQCDGCSVRHEGDMTPEGWTFEKTGDLCRECTKRQRAAEKASQHKSDPR